MNRTPAPHAQKERGTALDREHAAQKLWLADSGARREFATGSVRDVRTGKGRYDLLMWRAIHQLAIQLELGAEKYGPDNWRRGQPLSVYFDSMSRHAANFRTGKRDERHERGMIWNAMALVETMEMIREGLLPPELDDIGALDGQNIAAYRGTDGKSASE